MKMDHLTYAEFLLVFILPLLVLFGLPFGLSKNELKPHFFKGLWLLILLALVYTTPWDNFLVQSGVWSYQNDRVFGKIGYVPYEEYLFFILQTLFAGLWTFQMMQIVPIKTEGEKKFFLKVIGAVTLAGLIVTGIFGLFAESTRYLALITVWALPVILMQWLVGSDHFMNNFKVFLISFIPTTLYLWFADSMAIHYGVWQISSRWTTGLKIGELPVEEALFFAVTNTMVCMGLILFISLRHRFPKVYRGLGLMEVRG